jgi:hypothetical protein
MVEIGERTGALVVYAPARLDGEEIEIRPHGGSWTGQHTAVRARQLGGRVLHAGVFGSVPVGPYELRLRPSPSAADTTRTTDSITRVAVVEGTVVETQLAL